MPGRIRSSDLTDLVHIRGKHRRKHPDSPQKVRVRIHAGQPVGNEALNSRTDWLKKMRLVADLTDFPPMGRGPDSGDPGGDAAERGKTLGFPAPAPCYYPDSRRSAASFG